MEGRARALHETGVALVAYLALMLTGCGSGGESGDGSTVGGVRCPEGQTCPTAEAGREQIVLVGSKVRLDASKSV